MTTKTREDLQQRIAEKMMIVGAGQPVQAEDAEIIDDIIDPTIADLSARTIILVQDDDAIEMAVFEWLADCCAENLSTTYGRPRNPQITEYAETKLKLIAFVGPSYEVMKSEHF